MKKVLDTDKSIREITNLFDKEVHLSLGSGMTLFYHLLAQKIIQIDMLKPLNVEETIDETVEGTTEDFELIKMNKQVHKYTESPSVVKVQDKSTKQRTYEDESTKRYTFKDSGIRSASDTGGNRLARGIEHQSLQQVQGEGELGEFVHVLQELEDYKEVRSINI